MSILTNRFSSMGLGTNPRGLNLDLGGSLSFAINPNSQPNRRGLFNSKNLSSELSIGTAHNVLATELKAPPSRPCAVRCSIARTRTMNIGALPRRCRPQIIRISTTVRFILKAPYLGGLTAARPHLGSSACQA